MSNSVGLYNSIRTICTTAETTAANVFVQLKAWRQDPEFFKKFFQVFSSTLLLATISHPQATSNLSRFTFALQTANMHDFYQFLKQPRQWFFPVSADAIDENGTLASLETVIQTQFQGDAQKLTQAKDALREQLISMGATNDAYRNTNEFKTVMEKRLLKKWNVIVDLTSFNVALRHVPLLERITNYNWSIVDMLSVAYYAQGWKLVDTAKWADKVGQYQGFQWVKNQVLESWLIGIVCTAFALKLTEAVRKLWQDTLTPQDRKQAKWDSVVAAAELLYFGTIFKNRGQVLSTALHSTILCLGIAAKTLGLFEIATKKHVFFQKPVVVTSP